MAFRSGRRGIYREQSWTLSPIIILVCGPQFISSGFTVMTGLGLSQASGKTQPGTAVWESAPRTQAMTTSLACLPSLLPSPCRCLPPAPHPQHQQELSLLSWPPPCCHLPGRVLASLCLGVGTVPWQHTGRPAGWPGEHV